MVYSEHSDLSFMMWNKMSGGRCLGKSVGMLPSCVGVKSGRPGRGWS